MRGLAGLMLMTPLVADDAGAAGEGMPAVTRFLRALQGGQEALAYAQLSGDVRMEPAAAYRRFRSFVEAEPSLRNIEAFRILSVQPRGAKVLVRAELTPSAGEPTTVAFLVVEEASGWGIETVEGRAVFP